jgi:hypothetical protein
MVDARVREAHLAQARLKKAGDDLQDRGLAAAGRSEQRDQLTGCDRKIDVVERDGCAERMSDVLQRQRVAPVS